MTGWVRMSRSIFEHELFACEPLSEREAWLWLVAKAAWKDTRHRAGGELVAVPRGSLFVTLRELQVAWRWKSDTRVRGFLGRLEKERMIARESNAGKTHVTICNYARFQDAEQADNAPKTQPERTENALKEQGNKITRDISSSLRSEDSAPAQRRAVVDASESLMADDAVPADVVADWKRVRAAKKSGPITATVIAGLRREAAAAGVTVADAVRTCVERGWQGFRAEWMRQPARAGPDPSHTFAGMAVEAMEGMRR